MRHHEPVARVLWALQRNGFDPKPSGADRWVSRCPSHQGRRRNLSIARGDDGRALVHCHHADATGHGCQTEDIVQAIGLSLNELFAPGDSPPAQTVPRHRGDAALARIASTPVAALAGTI